jgi:preprotein translocase subunit SecB
MSSIETTSQIKIKCTMTLEKQEKERFKSTLTFLVTHELTKQRSVSYLKEMEKLGFFLLLLRVRFSERET